MAVNFHLANGASHPSLIPKDGSDEGVDLDSLLPVIQLIVAGVSAALWQADRRAVRKHVADVRPAAAPLAD